jgi:hypothetical protein
MKVGHRAHLRPAFHSVADARGFDGLGEFADEGLRTCPMTPARRAKNRLARWRY